MSFSATTLSSQWGTVLSTTLRNIAKNVSDAVTESLILFKWLDMKGHKKMYSGGQAIVLPVMLAHNTTAKSYRGYEPGNAAPQEGITSAVYPWRQVWDFITLSGLESFQNGGEYKIADILATKVDQAVISLQHELNRQAYLDGTGNGGKDILGLSAIVSETPSTVTVGMIPTSSTVNPSWQNQVVDGGTSGETVAAAHYRTELRQMYNKCTFGRAVPTIILSNTTLYELYEQTLVDNERYMNVEAASGDFSGLLLKGTPWFFDRDMPETDQAYFLNHNHLWWAVAEGADFSPSDFTMPPTQDAWMACIKCYGNLVTDNRRFQGVYVDGPGALS